MLPLLQAAVLPRGLASNDAFLAGYGAAQAVPGPLFTFAAYLGAAMGPAPNGWRGALICLLAIFLPSFLLVIGALPFWDVLRRRSAPAQHLAGSMPPWSVCSSPPSTIPSGPSALPARCDFALALAAFLLLFIWQAPPWAVVILCALGGGLIAAV